MAARWTVPTTVTLRSEWFPTVMTSSGPAYDLVGAPRIARLRPSGATPHVVLRGEVPSAPPSHEPVGLREICGDVACGRRELDGIARVHFESGYDAATTVACRAEVTRRLDALVEAALATDTPDVVVRSRRTGDTIVVEVLTDRGVAGDALVLPRSTPVHAAPPAAARAD